MDAARVVILREILSATEWLDRTRDFARSLRSSTKERGGLLLVGTPTEEPWHLAAHLEDEARYGGIPELSPTLVRWSPPPDAPNHLAIGLDRLEAARHGETVFVVAPEAPPAALLERVSDARKSGATILTIDTGDQDLEDLAHDAIVVPETGLIATPRPRPLPDVPTGGANAYGLAPSLVIPDLSVPEVSFEAVQHLVSVAAGENVTAPGGKRRGFRDRLARFLDLVSGPAPER